MSFVTVQTCVSPGFAWNEDLPYANPQNSERLMTDAPDRCRYVLEQPIVRPPGRAYIYNGGTTALLAAILQKAADRPLDLLAQRELFDPLGIGAVEWVRYRTVGDLTITGAVRSRATQISGVIAEISAATVSERGETRADDRTSVAAMEDRKREGYF